MKTKFMILFAVLFVSIADVGYAGTYNINTCAGNAIQIGNVWPGGMIYWWNTNPIQYGSSIPINPLNNQQYIVTVLDAFSSVIGRDTFNVFVHQPPTATITGPSGFCPGSYAAITASGGATYHWSNGATTATITVNQAINYVVTVTDTNGCVATASHPMVQFTVPQIFTVSSSSPFICPGMGGIIPLSGTQLGTQYQLFLNGIATGIILNGTGNPMSFTGIMVPGSYSVQATNQFGCQIMMAGAVSLITVPQVGPAGPISGPTSVCPGVGSQMYSIAPIPGATGYVWTAFGGTITWQGTDSVSVNWLVNGSLAVHGTNYCGTGLPSFTNVTVNPTPAVSLSPINPHICAGQSITLTATGANTYVWSGPNGFGFGTTYTVNTTSQVSVTGSNQYGCMSLTQTTSVYVEPIPSFTILGPTSPMCEGSPLQLTATATPQSTYKWTGPNGYTSTVQNPLIPNATLANAGTYLVKATSQWGCENTGQVIVSIHPTPIVSVNGTSPICSGSPLNLVAAISNGSSVSWNGPNGFASTLLNPVIYNTTSANAGWYVATASNGYCSMKDSTYVQVNAGPTISIAPSQNNICSGEAVDLYASGAMSYHWSTGQTGPNITVSPTITTPYTVTGMNIAGCTSSYTITITINGNSLTSIFTSGIDASCNGEHDGAANVQVLNGVPPMTYDWTPDPVNGDGNNAIGFAAGLVSVYYTDSRGCHGTNSILINEPAPITFAVPPIINGQNVSVTITGGTPPYQYGWSTGQTGNPVTFDPGIYVVSLTVNDGHYCQESFIINLASSGIDDVNTITFSIYPNPVSDILHIETGDVKIAEIQLLDITGKMILTAGKEKIINLTLFPAGFYLIQLTTKDGEILRSKVVKQ